MWALRLFLTITLLHVGWTYYLFPRDAASCPEPGTRCSENCTEVLFCLTAGGDPIPMFTCPVGEYCSTNSGQAACDAPACGSTSSQPCTKVGALPSATDCTQYYTCSKLGQTNPLLTTCEEGTVFNTMTSLCSDDIPCRDPVDCATAPAGFVDPIEEQYRYICDPSGNPIVFPNVASDNTTTTEPTTTDVPSSTQNTTDAGSTPESTTDTEEPTSPSTGEPSITPTEEPSSTSTEQPSSTPTEEPPSTPTEEPSSTPTKEPSSTPTEEPSSTPTEEPTSTTTEPTTPVECTATGERHPVRGDCHSFYQCNKPGDTLPTLKKCPPGFYYNPTAFACSKGDCVDKWWWSGGSFWE